jgi:acetyltransferase
MNPNRTGQRSETPLAKIMAPDSIAIVGASNTTNKMGTIQYLNLLHSGFPGEVFLVHPREEKIFGKKVYPSIANLPYAPDLALLVVPPLLTPSLLEEFGKLGTRHAIVISGGYKETGREGEEIQEQLASVARRYGICFVGPNCVGVINAQLPLNATVTPMQAPAGHLSIISQSGTYVAQTLSGLRRQGIRISKAISVGNEANIDIVDCLEYLEQDEETRAIGIYIECIRRPRLFLEVARRMSPHKPIVAQYVGGTSAGARAASTHTGAVAGQDLLYDGLFEQAGAIRAKSIEEIYLFAHTLAVHPPLLGPRIAILTNSGGPATAMANVCEEKGLQVPEFSTALQKKLRSYLPDYGAFRNPVDLTFSIDMAPITSVLPKLLLESGEIDGLLIHGIIETGWGKLVYPLIRRFKNISLHEYLDTLRVNLNELLEMPLKYNKPLCTSSFFGPEDHAVRAFHKRGIPTFDFPEKAAAAMGALYQHLMIRNRARSASADSP